MGKGSGRGGDAGDNRAEIREFVASFEDVSQALKNERAKAASSVCSETNMRVDLVPEIEIAELSKKIYATAKPYRGTATFSRSFMYVFRKWHAGNSARPAQTQPAATNCSHTPNSRR